MHEEKTLDPKILADAAYRFVRYGIAGLAAQGDLPQADAGRLLLAAIARWFGIGFAREARRAAGELAEPEKRQGRRERTMTRLDERLPAAPARCGAVDPRTGERCWLAAGHTSSHAAPRRLPGLSQRESAERGVVVWPSQTR